MTSQYHPIGVFDSGVGGLSVLRSAELQADGTRKVVAWYATVSGLTFHADADGRVYVDGPGCRVILFDPASPAWIATTTPASASLP